VDAFLIVIAIVLVGRTITAGNTLVTAELAAIALLLPVLVMLSRLADGTRSMLIAALLGTWLAWTALQPSLGHAGALSVNVPAMTDFFSRNPPQPAHLAAKGSATSRSPGCWPEQGSCRTSRPGSRSCSCCC